MKGDRGEVTGVRTIQLYIRSVRGWHVRTGVADTTLYVEERGVEENKYGRLALRYYSPANRLAIRDAMSNFHCLLVAIGKTSVTSRFVRR